MKKIIIVLILLAFIQTVAAQPVAEYLHTTTEINNGYAITTVEEKLTNHMDIAIDDKFNFLIPDEAFISGFVLIIDGKEYRADVLPKEEAAEKYADAVSKGRTAGLLEEKNSNLFSYSLNFAAKQSIIVRLTYEQALKKTMGEYEYVLFLRSTHTVDELSVTVNITSENDIISLETPGFTGANVKYLSTTRGQITYSTNGLPNSDLRATFITNNPPLNGNMLFYNTGSQGYLMHTFSPSEEELGSKPLSKDIIFVVDKSGSMRGQKIIQVKKVFTEIISDLPPDDNFNIIFFESYGVAFSDSLMEADAKNKADAVNFINGLIADGGTNINDALLQALAMFNPESERVPIIVFLTDGEPTVGTTSPYMIRQNIKNANNAEVSIFTIVFGNTHESNYNFLRVMSLENYGTSEWFFADDTAEQQISGFYETISTPLITDMEFAYTGQVTDIVNTGANNLFAGSDAIVLGKYPLDTSTITSEVAATTRNGNRNFQNTFNVPSQPENSFIPRLWAYTRIKRLQDRIDVEGETESLVSEITDISLEFEFVTPYTSLFVDVPTLVVDTEPEDGYAAVTPSATAMPTAAGTDIGYAAPTGTATPVPSPVIDNSIPTTDSNPSIATESGTSYPTYENTQEPGFEAVFAITGLLAIAYLLRRKHAK